MEGILLPLLILYCLSLVVSQIRKQEEKTKQQNKKENKTRYNGNLAQDYLCCALLILFLYFLGSLGVILSISHSPCFHTAPTFFTSTKILLTKKLIYNINRGFDFY